jgi:hypothetical protein
LQAFFLDRRQEEPLLFKLLEVKLPDAGGPARGGRQIQHASVDGRLHRDAHRQVARRHGLAGQPIALLRIFRAQLLGEAAVDGARFDPYAALAANPFAAAGGIDVDTGVQGRLDDRGA